MYTPFLLQRHRNANDTQGGKTVHNGISISRKAFEKTIRPSNQICLPELFVFKIYCTRVEHAMI